MFSRIRFTGPARYRVRGIRALSASLVAASIRRRLMGPRCPGWNWFVEMCTSMMKNQVATAFSLGDIGEARAFLDCIEITSPALSNMMITPVNEQGFRGTCFVEQASQPDITLLYFHGGGYSFYPRSYANFIALITDSAGSRTFALDYRLAPEHCFPAQLDDALNAYRWLIHQGVDPRKLVVAGDSAGAHLTLGFLITARDLKLPLPALAIALSPPLGFGMELSRDSKLDWIAKQQVVQWTAWFCNPSVYSDPRVSLLRADWRGLPPIYIQAGGAEILFDSIKAFVDHARAQPADVFLEAWPDMPHVFQVFGPDAPQSAEALDRIRDVISLHVRGKKVNDLVGSR
jgi:acetyl esterase/lipase